MLLNVTGAQSAIREWQAQSRRTQLSVSLFFGDSDLGPSMGWGEGRSIRWSRRADLGPERSRSAALRTGRGCGVLGGFLFFPLFFEEDCVTTVHLYGARTPFSGEGLVIQKRKGVGQVQSSRTGKNVILSTGRGLGVSRETGWRV